MRKFYVASSFKNKDTVRFVCQHLKNKGFIQTYDWTINERASTIENLENIGYEEREAVLESDFLIVILPAGKGSHIELGIALGQRKKIYLYSSVGEINNIDTTSTFYHLPEVDNFFGTIENLLEKVCTNEYFHN